MASFKLKERYILRGWKDAKYSVVDTCTGTPLFVNDITFQALSFCNGTFNIHSPIVLNIHRQIIQRFLKDEIIEECHLNDKIHEFQKYRLSPCRAIARVHWSITGKCNFKCRHCYMSAPNAKYGELSHEKCIDIINQLANVGITKISLTGGEPLVRHDFWDIVDYLLEKKIAIMQIHSNGALVNDILLDNFEKRGIKPSFAISFDGIGQHDWLRGILGAEQMTVSTFKLLQKRGFTTTVEMSLHKRNIHTLERSITLLASLGVSGIKVTPTSDAGNWEKSGKQYTLSPKELFDAFLEYIPKYKSANCPISIMLGGFFMCSKGSSNYDIPAKKFDGTKNMLNQYICSSARSTVYIAADGKVLPCIPLTGLPIQELMPNITEIPFEEILSDSKYSQLVDSKLSNLLFHNPTCNNCEHKFYCGGGCRAGALLSDAEYFDKDETTCYMFKNNYPEKIASIWNRI